MISKRTREAIEMRDAVIEEALCLAAHGLPKYEPSKKVLMDWLKQAKEELDSCSEEFLQHFITSKIILERERKRFAHRDMTEFLMVAYRLTEEGRTTGPTLIKEDGKPLSAAIVTNSKLLLECADELEKRFKVRPVSFDEAIIEIGEHENEPANPSYIG